MSIDVRKSQAAVALLVFALTAAGCTDANHSDGTATESGASSATVRPASSMSAVGEPPLAPVSNKPLYAKSFINRPAPELIVDTWVTSQPSTSGKMVLIDFWATWCPPCRAGIPKLNALHRRFADRLVMIGMSPESAEDVQAMAEPRIEYYQAVDPLKRTLSELGVQGIPHVIMVDPTGVVRWQGNPGLPGHELTEQVVESLLNTYVR